MELLRAYIYIIHYYIITILGALFVGILIEIHVDIFLLIIVRLCVIMMTVLSLFNFRLLLFTHSIHIGRGIFIVDLGAVLYDNQNSFHHKPK